MAVWLHACQYEGPCWWMWYHVDDDEGPGAGGLEGHQGAIAVVAHVGHAQGWAAEARV